MTHLGTLRVWLWFLLAKWQHSSGQDELEEQVCEGSPLSFYCFNACYSPASGECYRLYSSESYRTMAVESVPEIRRCSMSSTVLTLKALGIQDVLGFDFIDPPSIGQMEEVAVPILILC